MSEIDPSVGPFIGESYYMRTERGEVLLGPLTEEALKEYKEKTRQRKELRLEFCEYHKAAKL